MALKLYVQVLCKDRFGRNRIMKHQQVNVDYWTMAKTMFTYGALTALCWIMLRLFHTVFTLPRRLRSQQENIQNTLQDLQRRFPDLNITEEDLMNAEKELEEFIKEGDKENEEKKEKESESQNEKEDSKNAEDGKKELASIAEVETSEGDKKNN